VSLGDGLLLSSRANLTAAMIEAAMMSVDCDFDRAAGESIANRTSAVLAEAEENLTTLSRPFQGRQVEEALFARQG
jgi:hypothetical protein